MATATEQLVRYFTRRVSIAPLAIFRVAFGFLMFASTVRFMMNGWVHSMYIAPKTFFPFFDWIKPLPAGAMYAVFVLLALLSLCIMAGFLYRIAAVLFFALFTYIELIDKTNYLNHYYFISLVSFLLIFVPAGRVFSLDNLIRGRKDLALAPQWSIFILQAQMFIVYFFAGLAKINSDWLLHAQPLRTWLPAFSHWPLVGAYMEQAWVAYLFSWFGCIYDLSIGFLLFNRRTVNVAYLFVLVFHFATAAFFNIGMFPYIMITITIIFFRESFHLRLLGALKKLTSYRLGETTIPRPAPRAAISITAILFVFFILQLALPFRYLLYNGNLFWTEQGYRFSWRVMLMEKAGTAFFFVKDKRTGCESEVDSKEHLTYMQEKMVATQPDMMVDYAKYLRRYFAAKGYLDPEVRVMSYVTLNGSGSREFVDPSYNLAADPNDLFTTRNWVYSYTR